MEVILLDKVENLGGLGDRVRVKPGYARNYLVPQGKAKYATAANIAEFEARRAELEKRMADALGRAKAQGERLQDTTVTIASKAGGEGKLFGSVSAVDIEQALAAQGIEIERKAVRLPEGPIRRVGEYAVDLQLHPEVAVTIGVNVVAE